MILLGRFRRGVSKFLGRGGSATRSLCLLAACLFLGRLDVLRRFVHWDSSLLLDYFFIGRRLGAFEMTGESLAELFTFGSVGNRLTNEMSGVVVLGAVKDGSTPFGQVTFSGGY